MVSSGGLLVSSAKELKEVLTWNWQQVLNAQLQQMREAPIFVGGVVAAVRAWGWVLAVLMNVLLCLCIPSLWFFVFYGLYMSATISFQGLKDHGHYGDVDEDRANMDPAHNILYVVCLAQYFSLGYAALLFQQAITMAKEVSQAYGFRDGGHAVFGYFLEIQKGCSTKASSANGRNLITYAVELMQSELSLGDDSFLSGTLILDRLLTRQSTGLIEQAEQQQQQQLDLTEVTPLLNCGEKTVEEEWSNTKRQQQPQLMEQEIIMEQRGVIRQLIGSESSTQILQQLLETLPSRNSDGGKTREAAARIVEHVAGRIRLEQFPRGIHCISSLISTFEATAMLLSNRGNEQEKEQGSTSSSESDSESESELDPVKELRDCKQTLAYFWRLITSKINNTVTTTSTSKSESDDGMDQPSSSEANRSKTNSFHGYKELVLTGLHILWSLAGNEDNCTIISNTEHLVSKIMAPTSYNLVHRAGHSEWSSKVSESSLGVMLRLIVTAKATTRADLRKQVSNDTGAIATMEGIVTCEECKGGELQMKAMQILAQLCIDETANRGNLTKMLVSIFSNGHSCDASVRRTAGKTLAVIFLNNKSIANLLSNEEKDEFVGDLAKILSQVGDDNTCRESAAEILEHLCFHYTENEQHLRTLKTVMMGLMPKVLSEILSELTEEEGYPRYAKSGTDIERQVITYNEKNSNRSSSSRGQNQHHELHVALLSLCVTACDKLHLDLDTVLHGDQGECVAFSLAKKMVVLNRDLITTDNLKATKLITRMMIAKMMKLKGCGRVIKHDDLEILMDMLSSISETMLDLDGCMVFAAGTTAMIPDTADTLDFLVKQAQKLHHEMKDQESEIVPAS